MLNDGPSGETDWLVDRALEALDTPALRISRAFLRDWYKAQGLIIRRTWLASRVAKLSFNLIRLDSLAQAVEASVGNDALSLRPIRNAIEASLAERDAYQTELHRYDSVWVPTITVPSGPSAPSLVVNGSWETPPGIPLGEEKLVPEDVTENMPLL